MGGLLYSATIVMQMLKNQLTQNNKKYRMKNMEKLLHIFVNALEAADKE